MPSDRGEDFQVHETAKRRRGRPRKSAVQMFSQKKPITSGEGGANKVQDVHGRVTLLCLPIGKQLFCEKMARNEAEVVLPRARNRCSSGQQRSRRKRCEEGPRSSSKVRGSCIVAKGEGHCRQQDREAGPRTSTEDPATRRRLTMRAVGIQSMQWTHI
jgi:hypothetical protein